jgi:hypothetical protein
MKTLIAPAAASACPVCRHGLSSSDFVCTECGAVPALRRADGSDPSTADRVKSRFIAVYHRGSSTFRSALPKLVRGDRRWSYVVVALLATALFGVAVAGLVNRRDSVVDRGPSRNREPLQVQRPALPDRQGQVHRQEERRQSAGPPKANQTRSSSAGSTVVGMIGAGVAAVLLGAVAVKSQRRRRDDQSADNPERVRARRLAQAASIAAAFFFGLAVALAVVLSTASRVVQPLPAHSIVEAERVEQWRREASTLKERLSVLDSRLASLESTRTSEVPVRQQPGRAPRPSDAVAGEESRDNSNASAPAHYDASLKPPTADILRSPQMPAGPTVAGRVWSDIRRDWEQVRRSIRGVLSSDSR